jgi:phosphohistidine phosphatase SixA
MFVYLARHAWAGQSGDPGWADDSLRELTPEGIERYIRVIQSLSSRGFTPRRIATSPYTRCRQTAKIIARYVTPGATIDELEALEPGSDLHSLVEWTTNQEGLDVCWVGHNPDMPRLAAALLDTGPANLRFAKGSIAAVRFYGDVEPGAGELNWHVTAKLLGV